MSRETAAVRKASAPGLNLRLLGAIGLANFALAIAFGMRALAGDDGVARIMYGLGAFGGLLGFLGVLIVFATRRRQPGGEP